MNLVACPQCGARFDVSEMDPGESFVCGSCQNLLQVPGASAGPKKPAPKPPPSRPAGIGPGAGRGRRPDPRRAGGGAPPSSPRAAPTPPAPAPSAPSGRRASRRSYEPAEKSNLPLVLGGVGGLVVVVGIVLAIALSGSGDSGGSGGGGGGTTPVAGSPSGGGSGAGAEADPDSERDQLRRQVLSASTVAQLQGLYSRAKAAGFDDVAKEAAKYALGRDESLEWANRGVGKKPLSEVFGKYEKLLEKNPDVSTYSTESVQDLEELLGEVEWATPEQYERAERLLADAREHGRKLTEDREYGDVIRTKVWIRAHAVFSDYEYVVESKPPYVIAVQHHGKQEGVAREIADRNGKILQHLYGEFHRFFDPAFDLPDLSERERADERILKVFTFIDEEAFRKYQDVIRNPLPAGVRAYYYPLDQWITLFEGSGFEKQAAEGESDFNTNKIFHEGTHQLIHIYTKILMERDGGEAVGWENRRTSSRAHWFQEGFAELLGSSRPRADGLWDLLVPNRNRSVEWLGAQKSNAPEWTLEELLKIRDSRQLRTEAARKALAGADALGSLFYAQAWSFNHFLWHSGNGKYRDKLVEYFGEELRGRSGYDVWKKVWGKSDDDWTDLEEEWRAHFQKVCGELGIK